MLPDVFGQRSTSSTIEQTQTYTQLNSHYTAHSVLFSFEKIFCFENCICSFSIISENLRLLHLNLHCLLRSQGRFAVQKSNKPPWQSGLHCTIPYSRKNLFSNLFSNLFCSTTRTLLLFLIFLKRGDGKRVQVFQRVPHINQYERRSRLYVIHRSFYVPQNAI